MRGLKAKANILRALCVTFVSFVVFTKRFLGRQLHENEKLVVSACRCAVLRGDALVRPLAAGPPERAGLLACHPVPAGHADDRPPGHRHPHQRLVPVGTPGATRPARPGAQRPGGHPHRWGAAGHGLPDRPLRPGAGLPNGAHPPGHQRRLPPPGGPRSGPTSPERIPRRPGGVLRAAPAGDAGAPRGREGRKPQRRAGDLCAGGAGPHRHLRAAAGRPDPVGASRPPTPFLLPGRRLPSTSAPGHGPRGPQAAPSSCGSLTNRAPSPASAPGTPGRGTRRGTGPPSGTSSPSSGRRGRRTSSSSGARCG